MEKKCRYLSVPQVLLLTLKPSETRGEHPLLLVILGLYPVFDFGILVIWFVASLKRTIASQSCYMAKVSLDESISE